MTIVSLSFPDQIIKELDRIQDIGGFTGRSELVRAAIRLLIDDRKEKDSLLGHVNAVVVVTHDESNEAPITKLKHEFEDIVKTHIHNKITHGHCVELFLVEGEAKTVASMTNASQREANMTS